MPSLAAAAMQSVDNVLSRSYIRQVGALPFTAFGMGIGAFCLFSVCSLGGWLGELAQVTPATGAARAYLGVFGGAALAVALCAVVLGIAVALNVK